MSELGGAEPKKIQDLAFKIFAIIGFLSSIISIWAWFSASSASLSAVVTQKSIEMPRSLQLSQYNNDMYSLNSAITDLQEKYCNPVSVDYNGTRSRNFSYNQSACDAQRGFFNTIQAIAALDGRPLVAYDIKVTNDGTAVAENIKIRSPVDVQASARDDGGNTVRVTVLQDNRQFSIPALNPNESVNVRLISSTPGTGRI